MNLMDKFSAVEIKADNRISDADRALSAPVIKCQKTPRKKCRFVAEVRKKR